MNKLNELLNSKEFAELKSVGTDSDLIDREKQQHFRQELVEAISEVLPDHQGRHFGRGVVLVLNTLIEEAMTRNATTLKYLDVEGTKKFDLTKNGAVKRFFEYIDGRMDEFGLQFYDKENNSLGWLGLVLQDDSLSNQCFNCTANNFCEEICNKVDQIQEACDVAFEPGVSISVVSDAIKDVENKKSEKKGLTR